METRRLERHGRGSNRARDQQRAEEADALRRRARSAKSDDRDDDEQGIQFVQDAPTRPYRVFKYSTGRSHSYCTIDAARRARDIDAPFRAKVASQAAKAGQATSGLPCWTSAKTVANETPVHDAPAQAGGAKWLPEEDVRLTRAVAQQMAQLAVVSAVSGSANITLDYVALAATVGTRTPRQCRSRWATLNSTDDAPPVPTEWLEQTEWDTRKPPKRYRTNNKPRKCKRRREYERSRALARLNASDGVPLEFADISDLDAFLDVELPPMERTTAPTAPASPQPRPATPEIRVRVRPNTPDTERRRPTSKTAVSLCFDDLSNSLCRRTSTSFAFKKAPRKPRHTCDLRQTHVDEAFPACKLKAAPALCDKDAGEAAPSGTACAPETAHTSPATPVDDR